MSALEPVDVDRLIGVPETAERLAVSRATVYRMIHDGQLDAVKVRNKIRLPLRRVLALMDAA